MTVQTAYQAHKSPQHAHIEWLELKRDGVLHECAVMKRDAGGNVLYFRLADLDSIDKQRLASIISTRNASQLELWDLMSQHTLRNGINALAYFNQLVKMITPSGKIIDPRSGQVGVATVSVQPSAPQAPAAA